MNKIIIAVLAQLAFGFSCAHAEGSNLFFEGGVNALLSTKNSFSIKVIDQVSDGCLPHPNGLKDKFEVSLRKNGFAIVESEYFSNNIAITALGYQTSNTTCVVTVEASLEFPVSATVPHALKMKEGSDTVIIHRHSLGRGILSGVKTTMQERLEKKVTDYGDNLFLDISRARDDIFKRFPEIKASFEKP